MKTIEAIEELTSGTGQPIQVDDLATYRDLPITDDLNDNDIPSWRNVNDVLGNVPTSLVVNIPAGSPFPYVVDSGFTGFTAFGTPYKSFKQVQSVSATVNKSINDVQINEVYTDSSKSTYASLSIYGHDSGDGATTIDDLVVTLWR